MLRLLTVATLIAGLVAVTPALARPNCDLNGNLPGLTIEFGFSTGGDDSDNNSDGDDFDSDLATIELRKRGVDPRSVSRASDGCVEAFVQRPDGSWVSEYYDPDTWEQVD